MADEIQNGSAVGFYKAREESYGVLPAEPVWSTREPNSFDDLGAEYTKTARRTFDPSRQRKKGSTTDLDADGGYNEDLTQNNMQGELEEFFFAALRKTPEFVPTAVTATGYAAAGAAAAGVIPGMLVLATGYKLAANNGLKVVTAADADSIDVAGLTVEATATGKVKVVGVQLAAGDAELTAAVGNTFVLSTTAFDFAQLDLVPGSWIFIGDDAAATHFSAGNGSVIAGYARIALDGVEENSIAFDKATFVPATTDGAGKTIRLFYGDVLKNEEDPDLIVRFTSVMERTLGRDANGIQSEYITGAVANEMTWNSPLAGLVNIDMSYIAQKSKRRKGADGPLHRRADNTVIRALSEEAFNTSSNVYRVRLGMLDPDTMNPTALFSRVTEWSASIANNATAAKAQGTLGAFEATVGNFDVDVELTAYFTTVEAINAVECNWDLTFDALYAKANAGVYLDIPLLSAGGGRLDIEMDSPIMLPLENAAAVSPFGHTALVGWFGYLPRLAMPESDC